MFVLQSEITIGKYLFTQVNHVKIEESWKTIGDTASIQLPRLKEQLDKVIKVGDPVSIKIGYKDVLFREEFKGFVRKISPSYPYMVECEDYVFHAKRTNISKLFKEVTLKDVIKHIVNEINDKQDTFITVSANIPEVNFDSFRLNNVSAAVALQKIKDEYGLVSYFVGSKLFVGLPVTDVSGAGAAVKYSTSWNIIKSDLKQVSSEDRKYKIKAIAIQKDNTQLEVEVGDKDGELRTFFYYKITDKEKLKELATSELSKIKYTGFEGNFKTFFVPYATHSMVAEIEDKDYNDGRTGSYLIDSVTKEFGSDGARRTIAIGIKL
jgi:hypothetical protein